MDFIATGDNEHGLDFSSTWDGLKPSMASANFLATVLSDVVSDVNDIYDKESQSWDDEFNPLLIYAFARKDKVITDSIWIIYISCFGLIMLDSIEQTKEQCKVWYWKTEGASGSDYFTRKPRYSIQGLESTEDLDLTQSTLIVDHFFKNFAYEETTNRVSIIDDQDFDCFHVYSKGSGLYFDMDSLGEISQLWPFEAKFYV